MDQDRFAAYLYDNIITSVKQIVDNKLDVFREEIGELIKDKIAYMNNECDKQNNGNQKKRVERRPTYLSPTSAYSNDIARSASDNYFTLPNTISVNHDLDKAGGSQTNESRCDHIDDEDDDFASKVRSFFESSTLHGFHNLIDTAIWVRVLWILAMTGAFIPLSMQVIGLTNDYLSFHVTTDVSIHQGDKIFPVITVCNNRRFLSSKVAELPLFDKYKKPNTSLEYWQYHFSNQYVNLKPADFEYLGAEVNGTIAVKEAEIEPVPYHGSCYSVKPPPGSEELTIAFNLHVDESITYPEKKPGFTAYLTDNLFSYHHPLYEPVHEINVPLGHKVTSEISYDAIKRLNGSYAQCQDDEDMFYERTGLGYTQNTCLHECSFSTILSKCGCLGSPLQYFPFWVKTNKTGYETCKTNNEAVCGQRVMKTLEKCNCKPKCYTLIYGDVSKGIEELEDLDCQLNPFQEGCELLYQLTTENITKDWQRNNTAFLTIYLTNTPYKTYVQHARYPLLRFMSDIGGTMGLYLGASILTTFEFVQMAISGVLHVVRKIKQKYCPK